MTLQIQTSILDLFKQRFTAAKTVVDNQSLPNPPDEWVRISIRFAAANQASMAGTPTTRTTGSVIVQCFVKPNIGMKRAAELADLVEDALMYRQARGNNHVVVLRAAVMTDVGQPEGQPFYQTNVVVPFYADAR